MAEEKYIARPTGPQGAIAGYFIHKIKGEGSWTYKEHGHQGYGELVCVTRGDLRQEINGRVYHQKAGEIVYVREKDSHSLSGEDFTYVNVMFNESWLSRLELYMESPGMAGKLAKSTDSPRAIVPLYEQARVEQSLEQLLSNSSSVLGKALFGEFLLKVVTKYLVPLQRHSFADEVPDWLRETLIWLSDQRPDYPTLQALVKQSCRCHEHFSREFSRHVGVTPSRYLANLKIEHAAEMLLTTNHKLLEVCRASGFENESYFFRLFKKSKGITPLEYRRAYGRNSIQRQSLQSG